MQLIHHAYSNKPDRLFIDSRRVSKETFELSKIKARLSRQQHSSFVTRRRNAAPVQTHYVHYSCLT
jgi:hypothetical protein